MASPKLRFKEFEGNWSKKRLDSFLERISNPVNVVGTQNYIQIGIRSHGKGIFHKESVTGKELGNKRVFWVVPNALVVNIVFAWERAIAVTSDKENGLIASHRFPMYAPKDGLSDVNFLRYMFITDKGQSYLEFASPGGAGRNKTLGQSNFAELKIDLPTAEEQTKIASFLSVVDERIGQLSQKHELLSQYKQGMMQKLFSQQIRFKADDGSEFGECKNYQLKDIADVYDGTHQTPNYVEQGVPFYSVEHVTANDFSNTKFIAEDVYQSELKRVSLQKGDILMTRIGDIGTSRLIDWDVRASFYVSLALIKIKHGDNSSFIDQYIKSQNFQRELHERTIHVAFPKKINLGEIGFCMIQLPCLEEQTKIADFLSAIDQKIETVAQQIEQVKQWKKGLLQQMFV
ncbi:MULTISPECIES: restriction endonuclease subunit S [unclassified Acinetobacter]|uniref:restriction endonuclease subunit S n=1 Tax=unclassified Acinetobacter TaxID=196816 RepID=UPI0015D3BA8D|nr:MULTISPECIES: restriction endonuclease subunit S [unclassified Acinetobacter]